MSQINNRKNQLYYSSSWTTIADKASTRQQENTASGSKLYESSNLSYKNQDNQSHQSYLCSPILEEQTHKLVIQEENDELQKSENIIEDIPNMDQYVLQPKREFQVIFQERLDKEFAFDAEKNSKIVYSQNDDLYTYSDIFDYFMKCHKGTQNMNDLIRNFKDFYLKNQVCEQEGEQYWHKIIYSSRQRQSLLEYCGVTTYKDQFQGVQNQKVFHMLKGTGQYNRLVVVMSCLFSFENIKQNLPKAEQAIVPLLLVAINLYKQFKEDKGDRDFYIMETNYQYLHFPEASKIQDYFGFKGENQSLLNLTDSTLRQYNYQKILNMIRAVCKGIQHEDPYIQLFYNFFGMENSQFQQYLISENTKIHFYDKLTLSLLYCDDKTLYEFLEKTDSLDQIIGFGVSSKTIECLKKYLQKTNDIQLVGIISAHLFLLGHSDQEELAHWFFQYQELLNQHQLYNERILIENQIKLQSKDKPDLLQFLDKKFSRTSQITHQCWCMQNAHPECSSCFTLYPKCSICFSPIQFQQYVVCLKCKHGGHEKHIQEWFTNYNQCPYKKCRCQCFYN